MKPSNHLVPTLAARRLTGQALPNLVEFSFLSSCLVSDRSLTRGSDRAARVSNRFLRSDRVSRCGYRRRPPPPLGPGAAIPAPRSRLRDSSSRPGPRGVARGPGNDRGPSSGNVARAGIWEGRSGFHPRSTLCSQVAPLLRCTLPSRSANTLFGRRGSGRIGTCDAGRPPGPEGRGCGCTQSWPGRL